MREVVAETERLVGSEVFVVIVEVSVTALRKIAEIRRGFKRIAFGYRRIHAVGTKNETAARKI